MYGRRRRRRAPDGLRGGRHESQSPQFTIPGSGVLTFYPGQQGWSGSRAHSFDDGHAHSVRVRIESSIPSLFGFVDLDYYDGRPEGGEPGDDFPDPNSIVVADLTPGRFELKQAVGAAARIQARLLRANLGGGQRASVVPHETGQPVPWDPTQGMTRLLIAVPQAEGVTDRTVRVRLHDQAGRVLAKVVDEPLEPGYYLYEWDGWDSGGERLPPGVYIAVMEAKGYRGMVKLILTR